MSVPCQKIDPAQWPRSESFAFFSSLDQPFYSVCFRVDVTALHAYTKANGLSFYHSMVWLVTQAVNETENLRYTLRGGEVYLLPARTPSFTELKRAASSSGSSPFPGILRFPPSAARRRRKASGRPRFSSPPRRPMTSSTSPACRGSTSPAARTNGILTRTTPSPASPGANTSGRAAARRWASPSRSTTALSTACISAGSMKPCSKKSTIWSNQTNP